METSLADTQAEVLETSAGDFPLHESRLRVSGHDWTVLHAGLLLTFEDEQIFLSEFRDKLPYGVALWPSAIALAHEVAARGDAWRGNTVLELGAGTGLPGIVAASLGAKVVQMDRHEVPMAVCRKNGERNGVRRIDYRLADWTAWDDAARYDYIIGADILYRETFHPDLRRIFAANLAPGGRILVADPFRPMSLRLLEALETEGWRVSFTRWNLGDDDDPKAIGVFEIVPP